jgi:hypothetical protein
MQADVGDGWRDLAAGESRMTQAGLQRRAVWWHEKVLPQATGLQEREKEIKTFKDAQSRQTAP